MLTSSVRTGRLILLAAFVALPATWPITARGQSPQASDVDRRLKELEETVDRLKKDQRQTEVNLENQKPLAGWSAADGFTLTSPDGKLYKLRLGGYTQFDGRFFIHEKSASGVTDQFLFRRARIDLQGTVFKYFDFRILPDFAPSTPILFDAYLDANYIPEAKLRFGKFKPPVGLERLQGVRYIEFIERAQPTNLVPNRDFGVQLFGDLVNGILGYQLAIVNGVPDNSNPSTGDVNNDKDFDGRFFVLPFKNTSFDPVRGLGLGFAGSYGNEGGTTSTPDLPTYKTFGQATFFQYNGATASGVTPARSAVFANGFRARCSPQFYEYWGPFGLLGEYVISEQRVARNTLDTSGKITSVSGATLSNDAWQIAGSWVITGEAASYKGVIPAQPFDPFAGKWGALEVAARYGQLEVDPDAFSQGFANPNTSARRDKEWVIGANWYLNRNIKAALDYAHSDFSGGAANGGDRPTESAIVGRIQLLL